MSYDQKKVPTASKSERKASQSSRLRLPTAVVSRNESNTSSSISVAQSAGHRIPGSFRGTNVQNRPSVPSRSSSSPLSSRPDALESYSPPYFQSSRIPHPPGISSETVSSAGRTRKVLRRKAPSVEQYASSLARCDSIPKPHIDAVGPPDGYLAASPDATFRTTTNSLGFTPKMTSKRPPAELPPALIPELKALAAASASNPTAASKSHVPLVVSSPSSTQYSGSTGPWSTSRNTTPSTSISSCSPGIMQPSGLKETSRLRKAPNTKSVTPTPPPRTSSIKSTRHRSANASRLALDRHLPTAKAGGRPHRPNREGTPDLEVKSNPVIQSNLSPQSLRGYQRRNSFGARNLGPSIEDIAPGRGARTDYEDCSVSDVQPLHSSRLPVTTRSPDPPTRRMYAANESVHQASEQSIHGRLSSRLSIFSRRSKTSRSREDASTEERRDVRKGPAAGTGHEAYGKYAKRGRKYSAGSVQNNRDQSSSTTSRRSLSRRNSQSSAGGSEIDDLVLQRQTPIIITGGGGREPFRDSSSMRTDSSLDLTKQLTPEPPGSIANDSASISAASADAILPSPVLSKIVVTQAYAPPQRTPLDGSGTSQSSFDDDGDLFGHSKANPCTTKHETASKTRRKLRWNILQRNVSAEGFTRREGQVSERMEVAVAPVSVEKPLPFYALMDSENENDGGNDLQDLLDQLHQESSSFVAEPTSDVYGLSLRQQSLLLPAMPALTYEDSRHARPQSPILHQRPIQVEPIKPVEAPSSQPTVSKLNRLPQIGRIPRVVYRRDREYSYTPATASFSRPFRRGAPVDAPREPRNCAVSIAPSISSIEEEIWDEYDDLLDHVMSPISPATSYTRLPTPQRQP